MSIMLCLCKAVIAHIFAGCDVVSATGPSRSTFRHLEPLCAVAVAGENLREHLVNGSVCGLQVWDC